MKWSFDALMAIICVEENRLFFGRKIENFLSKKLNIFLNFLKLFFSNQFGGFFCCFLIILLSLFKRSMVDIGQDSGLYLEIAQKIFEGKKYYHDFFEYNFPISFLFLIIPVGISNLLGLSPIIIAEYFVNLLGIFSLIWSYKILKNSQKIQSQLELNLLIICFTAGFFIRGKTLFFNEFLTKTSFLIIFFFPFFSYYVYGVEKLKKIQKIYLGILSGLIISLKPNFIILVFCFEIFRVYKSRNIKSLLDIHNFFCALFIILYLTLIAIFFTSFAENFSYMMSIYSEYKLNYQNKKYLFILNKIEANYLPYFMLILIYIKNLQKNEVNNYLILLISVIIFIIFSENFYIDEEIIFSALGLSFIIINFTNFLKQNKISLLHYWLVFFSLIIFCFMASETFSLISSTLYYLGLPILIYLLFFRHFVDSKSYFYVKIFLIFSTILLIFLQFNHSKLFDIFLTLFLIIISLINLNLFLEKYRVNKFFFQAINFVVFFATIGFAGEYFRAIFNNYSPNETHFNLQSPNHQNKFLFEIAKSNIKNNDNLIIFGDAIENSYPFRNYAKLRNDSEFSQYDILANSLKYPIIHYQYKIYNNKVLESFYQQIINPKNKIIIFYNYRDCTISNFEFVIRSSPEIKEYFLENFQFLTQHFSVKEDKSFTPNYTQEFLTNDEFEMVKGIDLTQPKIIKNDVFEAYVRK